MSTLYICVIKCPIHELKYIYMKLQLIIMEQNTQKDYRINNILWS